MDGVHWINLLNEVHKLNILKYIKIWQSSTKVFYIKFGYYKTQPYDIGLIAVLIIGIYPTEVYTLQAKVSTSIF